MKCKYCGAKGIKISHFMRKHKALMLRKMHRGRHSRGKGSRGSPGGKGHVLSTGGHGKARITFYD